MTKYDQNDGEPKNAGEEIIKLQALAEGRLYLLNQQEKRHKETVAELIRIADTINKFAFGPKPGGGCQCDHGEDGRCLLRGEKCGRCKALGRLKEIKKGLKQ